MRCLSTAGLIAGLALAGPLAAYAEDAAPEPAEARPEAAAEAGYDASTVLATVNGTDITLGHIVALIERLPEQFLALPDETLMDGLIDQLVDQTLLADTVSAAPDDDPLAVRLHLDNERRGTLAQQAVLARTAADVDDAAVQEAYDAAFADYQPQTEFNASHIIVPTEEEAAALREELDAGADFAELAQEHSQDGAAARGGELGWFGPGMMVPEFEAEVREMEVGEVRGPIPTQFGWHLIRLNETRQSAPPALDEVRDQFADQIRQRRLTEEIEELRAAADIDRPDTEVPAAAIRDVTIIEE